MQEDVLAKFGAVGGELPNRDPCQTAALQDTVICYDKPHRLFKWEYLGSLIEEVVQLDAKYLPCFPFTDPAFSKQFFCLGLEPLSCIAYAVVAVQQILEALMIFLGKDPRTSFTLDPNYGLLGLLECSAHEAELRFTVTSLQRWLSNGNKHILSYFHSIRHTLVDEEWNNIGSSANSTLPEIRREFGTLNPTQEMYRLLLRPDYALRATMIDDEARASMVRRLGESPWERYYRPRKSLPTIKEGSVKGPTEGVSVSQNAAPPMESEPHGVRFTAPPSLSAVHRLPGQGFILNTEQQPLLLGASGR
jgi:hypothetical protein